MLCVLNFEGVIIPSPNIHALHHQLRNWVIDHWRRVHLASHQARRRQGMRQTHRITHRRKAHPATDSYGFRMKFASSVTMMLRYALTAMHRSSLLPWEKVRPHGLQEWSSTRTDLFHKEEGRRVGKTSTNVREDHLWRERKGNGNNKSTLLTFLLKQL